MAWHNHSGFNLWMRACAQSCRLLGDLMDCSPPGSSVPGILQARTLEWVASPGDLPSLGIKPVSPVLADEFFTTEPPAKPGFNLVTYNLGNHGNIPLSLFSLKSSSRPGMILLTSLSPGDTQASETTAQSRRTTLFNTVRRDMGEGCLRQTKCPVTKARF